MACKPIAMVTNPTAPCRERLAQVSQNSAIWPRPAAVPAIPGPRCDGDDVIGLQRMLHAQQKTETENAEHASLLVSQASAASSAGARPVCRKNRSLIVRVFAVKQASRSRLSSAVEQWFCKPKVGGSIPSAGTTPLNRKKSRRRRAVLRLTLAGFYQPPREPIARSRIKINQVVPAVTPAPVAGFENPVAPRGVFF